jgi:hypothetical protein
MLEKCCKNYLANLPARRKTPNYRAGLENSSTGYCSLYLPVNALAEAKRRKRATIWRIIFLKINVYAESWKM